MRSVRTVRAKLLITVPIVGRKSTEPLKLIEVILKNSVCCKEHNVFSLQIQVEIRIPVGVLTRTSLPLRDTVSLDE